MTLTAIFKNLHCAIPHKVFNMKIKIRKPIKPFKPRKPLEPQKPEPVKLEDCFGLTNKIDMNAVLKQDGSRESCTLEDILKLVPDVNPNQIKINFYHEPGSSDCCGYGSSCELELFLSYESPPTKEQILHANEKNEIYYQKALLIYKKELKSYENNLIKYNTIIIPKYKEEYIKYAEYQKSLLDKEVEKLKK